MKLITKTVYLILFTFLFFFIFAATTTIFLQTNLGKAKLERVLQKSLSKKGLHIYFKEVKGFLPFQWTFNDLEIKYEQKRVSAKSISFRISFLKLFKNTLSLRSIQGSCICFEGFETTQPSEPLQFALPMSIQLKSFDLHNVFPPNTNEAVHVKGSLQISKNGEYLSLKSKVTRSSFINSYIHINLKAEKQRLVQLTINGNIEDANFIRPLYRPFIEGAVQFKIYANGPWNSFENVIFQNITKPLKDISGSLFFTTERLHVFNSENINSLFTPQWKYQGNFTISQNRLLTLSSFNTTSKFLSTQGSLTISNFKEIKQGDFNFQTHNLNVLTPSIPIEFFGNVKGQASIKKENDIYLSSLDIHAPDLIIKDTIFKQATASLTFTYKDQVIDGKTTFTSDFNTDQIDGSFLFQYRVDENLNISDLAINTKWLHLNGDLELLPKGQIEGVLYTKSEESSFLQVLFPHIDVKGSFSSKIELTHDENTQQMQTEIELSNLTFNTLNVQQGTIFTMTEDMFGARETSANAKLKNVRYFDYSFTSLDIFISFDDQNWPFEIIADGCPLQFTSRGFWSYQSKSLHINLQELFGLFYEMPYLLTSPADIFWGSDEFDLSFTEIAMGNGSFNGSIYLNKNQSDVHLLLQNFPADFLSINPLDVSVQGILNGKIDLAQVKNQLNGSIALSSPQLSVLPLGENDPLILNGLFQTLISDNQFKLLSELFVEYQKVLNIEALFSGYVSWFPLNFTLDTSKKTVGNLLYKGQIEHFIDFFNIDPNYIKGNLSCDVQWQGTINNPKVTGDLEIENGVYENFTAGIYIENITGKMIGNNDLLEIISFEGKDTNQGTITAQGAIKLSYLESFPFEFQLSLNEMQAVDLQSIIATTTGDLLVHGNFNSAVASGHLLINEIELYIPERLPSSIPTIDVSYKNLPLGKKQIQFKQKFPLTLDVLLEVPETAFVYGRGLSSQWGGQLKLEGLYTSLITKGRLDLIKGDFNFSGHVFDLTSGELVFTEEPNAIPFLNIFAKTNVQGITITAKWSGKLKEPNLEFTSLPPMPLSSILSYLLFGSDLSEITALQAVTLATTAATLSGSPDILEITRRRLGVDKLAVVSSPTSEGDEGYAVQVGKYVADGVLLSFSQGIEQGSTNIIVNVDLKYGFMFQAETIQQQEQGRFSLLWNRNF